MLGRACFFVLAFTSFAACGGGGAGTPAGSGGASGSGGAIGTGGAPGTGGGTTGTGGGGGAGGSGGAVSDGGADSAMSGDVPAEVAPASDAGKSSLGFFVTSRGTGDLGGNLGGLAGADARCQMLAAAAGAGGRTFHAYLSLSGPAPVNARDRIGKGPWYNAKGVKIAESLAQLHDEGMMNALSEATAVDENGRTVPIANPNEHDIFTGSSASGMAMPATPDVTCNGWTSAAAGTAQCGHCNRMGNTGNPPTSWNSAHATSGCTPAQLSSVGATGRIYCFAID